jgi:hypothetical protein
MSGPGFLTIALLACLGLVALTAWLLNVPSWAILGGAAAGAWLISGQIRRLVARDERRGKPESANPEPRDHVS